MMYKTIEFRISGTIAIPANTYMHSLSPTAQKNTVKHNENASMQDH